MSLVRAKGQILAAGGLLAALFSASPLYAQNNPPSRAGFPVTINGRGTSYGHPAVADLKWGAPWAGYKSIVFTTWDGTTAWLHVLRYDGASATAAFPPVALPAQVQGSPAVGDLDGDGIPEIVVPYGSTLRTDVGGVRAFRRTGTQLWDYPNSHAFPSNPGNTFPFGVVSTPAIGDLDGNGTVEVAWGAFDGKIYVVDGATGADRPGWPIFVRDTIWSSPVLFDLDGDGKKEVIIGVDAHLEGAPYNTVDGGALHVFRYNGSGTGSPAMVPVTELPGFPVNVDQTVFSAPAVGDIDGDGKPEIVFGTGTYWGNPGPCGSGIGSARARRVYALKCNGTAAPGWPVVTDAEVKTGPALADLDGDDSAPEVIVTDIDCSAGNPAQNYSVYAFSGNGTRRFKTQVTSFFGQSLSAGDPVVADVFGDGKPEILIPSNTEIAVFSNTGSQLTDSNGFSLPQLPTFYTQTTLGNAAVTSMKVSPTVSDPVDVIAIGASPFPSAANTEVNVWNPFVSGTSGPKKTYSEPDWGMFRQNPARTGLLPGTLACVVTPPPPTHFFSLPPCRAIDTRNANGPYGGPSLGPAATRTFNLAGRCSVPADAKSVSGNVTAVLPTASGFLTLYPGGTARPSSSSLNFSPGLTRANNIVVPLSTDGNASLSITNGGASTTNVLFDVNGYFK